MKSLPKTAKEFNHMHEFDIINTFFQKKTVLRADVSLGSGDDGAILKVPTDKELVITTDTLVENVHFLKTTPPNNLGYKALAVNLSDLAAMGATPAWVTMNLTLPEKNMAWLTDFSQGFFLLADKYSIQLIGGDLTQGPLSITISAYGFVPTGTALRRDGANPGDLIYVTHTVGNAAGALAQLQSKQVPDKFLLSCLEKPHPRVAIGHSLRGVASAAIDISDGVIADLQHILKRSGVGAKVNVDDLPLSSNLLAIFGKDKSLVFGLTGGDDYELCFTLPAQYKNALDFPCTCIGIITEDQEYLLQHRDGSVYQTQITGYQHF